MGYFADTLPIASDAKPRIERPGGTLAYVVLTTSLGAELLVRDYVRGPDGWRRCTTPSEGALARTFLYRDGTLRCYHFRRGERRTIDPFHPERLERQYELAAEVRAGSTTEARATLNPFTV